VTTILETPFVWKKNESIAIRIKYFNTGKWSMAYNRLADSLNYYWLKDTNYPIVAKGPWIWSFKYNYGVEANAGSFWVDNVSLEQIELAASIISYDVIAENKLKLIFSKGIVLPKSDYSRVLCEFNSSILLISTFVFGNSDNELVLSFDSALESGEYNLIVNQLENKNSSLLSSDSLHFSYNRAPLKGELVVNEFLSDPFPVVGLPELEFVEIYNKSEGDFYFEDFFLNIGGKQLFLSGDTLK